MLALGVRVDIEVPVDFEADVRRAWDRCLADGDERPAAITLEVSDTDVRTALHNLSMTMNRTVTEQRAGEVLTLHGAALADPRGRTALLVATSGTGKTTLSRTLGPRWGYLSDESAGVTPEGLMVGYPKPLSIVRDDWRKEQLSPTELGLLEPAATCRISAIVLLNRDAEAAEVSVTPVGLIASLPRLASESFQLARHDRPLHVLANAIELAGGVHEVRYAEAADLEPVLLELL
jgi:hypothetical protein